MPTVHITMPTLHADQVRAYQTLGRYKVIRCGRRWGKSTYGVVEAVSEVLRRGVVGWFAPDYRRLSPPFKLALEVLGPIKVRSSQNKTIICANGGQIDFWSLGDTNAGRGEEYDLVILDETAFAEPVGSMSVTDIYQQAIEPTLLIRRGRVIAMSNTNGDDPDNFFWRICNLPEYGFTEYYAPSVSNPLVTPEEIEHLRANRPPLVFAQEYLAQFVNWAGTAFFEEEKMLVLGQPVAYPQSCTAVYACIDTATKTGKENDGTAVVYCALTHAGQGPHPLVILDWDLVQMEGSLLETWLPTVFQKLETLAAQCRARAGSVGVFIEDKASGMVLIQQAARRGWPARPIDSKLTALGKSERAISVSGYVYRGDVKFSAIAHQKVYSYKGVTRNHLLHQILSFRVGTKDMTDDDLLDAWTYSVAVGLGDIGGF